MWTACDEDSCCMGWGWGGPAYVSNCTLTVHARKPGLSCILRKHNKRKDFAPGALVHFVFQVPLRNSFLFFFGPALVWRLSWGQHLNINNPEMCLCRAIWLQIWGWTFSELNCIQNRLICITEGPVILSSAITCQDGQEAALEHCMLLEQQKDRSKKGTKRYLSTKVTMRPVWY